MKTKSAEKGLFRIKRFGASGWATCGIGVRPPEPLVGDPRMKKLCPKLVPGQVIELPRNHPLLKNRKLIEEVDGLDDDEFLRPWVFKTAEQAVAANPSKSRQGADQIAAGLALTEGAQEHQARKLVKRKQAVAELEDDIDGYSGVGDDYGEPDFANDEGEELEDEVTVAKRAKNSVSRDIKDDAWPIVDDEDDNGVTMGGERGERYGFDEEEEPPKKRATRGRRATRNKR